MYLAAQGEFKCRATTQITELQQLTKFFLLLCTKLDRLVYGYGQKNLLIADFLMSDFFYAIILYFLLAFLLH